MKIIIKLVYLYCKTVLSLKKALQSLSKRQVHELSMATSKAWTFCFFYVEWGILISFSAGLHQVPCSRYHLRLNNKLSLNFNIWYIFILSCHPYSHDKLQWTSRREWVISHSGSSYFHQALPWLIAQTFRSLVKSRGEFVGFHSNTVTYGLQ